MFGTTRPSLIQRALQGGDDGQKALGELFTIYRPAIRRYVLAYFNDLAPDVDEVVNDFLFKKFTGGKLIDLYKPGPGRKFRSLLGSALKNYCIDTIRKQNRRQVSLGGPTYSLDERFDLPDRAEADGFDVAWARQVFGRAIRRVKRQCDAGPPRLRALWGVWRGRFLQDFREKPLVGYPDLVRQYGYSSTGVAQKAASKAKEMMAEAMRAIIAEYTRPGDVQAELADLRRILHAAGGLRRRRCVPRELDEPNKESIVADTHGLETFFDPDFENRRVWHPRELGGMLEHQWSVPLRADLHGQPAGQARLLAKLCDADHLLLKSYGDVFGHPLPPVELLMMIKEFAQRNIVDPDPGLPIEIAELLYVLSVVVARTRCGRTITSLDDAKVRRNIEHGLSQTWISQPVVEILQEGLPAFGGTSVSCDDAGGG